MDEQWCVAEIGMLTINSQYCYKDMSSTPTGGMIRTRLYLGPCPSSHGAFQSQN